MSGRKQSYDDKEKAPQAEGTLSAHAFSANTFGTWLGHSELG